MKRLLRAMLAALVVAGACAPAAPALAGDDLAFDPRITSIARLLAGVAPDYALHARIAADPGWQAHRDWLAPRWERLRASRLQAIEAWRDEALAGERSRCRTLFYPFSGPDFLNAYLLFPSCDTYVFLGLEPPGALPEIDRLGPGEAAQTLRDMRAALGDLLAHNFFMTKRMAEQLHTPRIRGVLPVMLASMGVIRVRVVSLRPYELATLPGVAVTFFHPDIGKPQTLYYLSADLSDAGLRAHPALAHYLDGLAPAAVLVKSASYLLHRPTFTRTRDTVLRVADVLVQDDTGVPYRTLREQGWTVRLYGNYGGPIPLFAAYRQPDLEGAFRGRAAAHRLPFAFGYKGSRDGSIAMVARIAGR
ncbi:MAG: hypothetical protein IT515_06535 [Burkholderiales bacterium]|nr:hypothetical protein [Burkholderiales bacterium]